MVRGGMWNTVLLVLASVGSVQAALTHRYVFEKCDVLHDSVGGADLVLGRNRTSAEDLYSNEGPNPQHQDALFFPEDQVLSEIAVLPTLDLTQQYADGWSMCYWVKRSDDTPPGATWVAAWDPKYNPATETPDMVRAYAYYTHQHTQMQLHDCYSTGDVGPNISPAKWTHYCVTYDNLIDEKPKFYENATELNQLCPESNAFSIMGGGQIPRVPVDPVRITPAIGKQHFFAYRWNSDPPVSAENPPEVTEYEWKYGKLWYADVKVYSHVLSAADVVEAMNEEAPPSACGGDGGDGTEAANPQVPFYGYGAIIADPNPPVVGEPTSIEVTVKNAGAVLAEAVEVVLSFHDWGVSWGGWQEIGAQTVETLGAGAAETMTFEHVFENRAHTCLEAKLVGVGAGGNTVLTDDRGQINLEVVRCEEDCGVEVPFTNAGEAAIQVENVMVGCLPPGAVLEDVKGLAKYPCPLDQESGQPLVELLGLEAGALEVEAGGEVLVQLAVAGLEEPTRVVVQGQAAGEWNHVVVAVVPTSVEALLNQPHLCCLESVKLRVLLESLLAEALDAYEAGECRRAVQLLRLSMQKAILLECDVSAEEKACLESVIAVATDAARMIAQGCGTAKRLAEEGAESGVSAEAAARATEFTKSGDMLRRAGLSEAAAFEYSRGTEKGWVRVSKKVREGVNSGVKWLQNRGAGRASKRESG